MDDLTKLRNTINKIDNQLFALLDQRFELSRRVKEVKKSKAHQYLTLKESKEF